MKARAARFSLLTTQDAGRVAVFLAVAAVGAAAYASTLMTTVSGGDSPYTVDSGEFQVALAEWGTVHHTGYPLYMLLGSPFVAALRGLGVAPAAGASLFSLVWAALAAGGAGLLLLRLGGRAGPALALGAGFALTRSVWIHGAVPEVYSLSLLITVGILWLALDLLERWDERRAWLTALLFGVGVAHHRLLAVALPVLALAPAPGLYLRGPGRAAKALRWLAVALLLFALGFLPYLDMPLRVWRGADWVYGRPDTWQGFWFLFFGTEVEDWQRPVFEAGALLANARAVASLLARELTWPGLIAALAGTGLALMGRGTRRAAVLLAGVAAAYAAFTVLVYRAVLPEANLMTTTLCLVLGLGLGLRNISPQRRAGHEGGGQAGDRKVTHHASRITHYVFRFALLAFPLLLFLLNRQPILAIARDPAGVDYIRQMRRLEAPAGAVVMAPWGWRYFSLSYAQRVDGLFADRRIVDHRADFAALAAERGAIYTAADSFYIFTAEDFWRPRLGAAHLTSAGPGLVRVSARPEMRAAGAPVFALGDGLGLLDLEARPLDGEGEWQVVVRWTATARPSRDYSTFVHMSDQEQIAAPEDVIAQSDQVAPVYAWYATGRWAPGEVVREDHLLRLPPDRLPRLIVVGMYRRDEAGNFIHLGQAQARPRGENWEITE